MGGHGSCGFPDENRTDGSGIRQGDEAMLAWQSLVFDDLNTKERAALADQLIEYCNLDTSAMLKIWQVLERLIS